MTYLNIAFWYAWNLLHPCPKIIISCFLMFFSNGKSAIWFDPATCQMRLSCMQTLNIIKVKMTHVFSKLCCIGHFWNFWLCLLWPCLCLSKRCYYNMPECVNTCVSLKIKTQYRWDTSLLKVAHWSCLGSTQLGILKLIKISLFRQVSWVIGVLNPSLLFSHLILWFRMLFFHKGWFVLTSQEIQTLT